MLHSIGRSGPPPKVRRVAATSAAVFPAGLAQSSGSSGAWSWGLAGAAVAVWAAAAWVAATHRAGWARRAEPTSRISSMSSPGFPLLLASFCIWLSMSLFGGAARAMMAPPLGSASASGVSEPDLRDLAIVQMGGYAGAVGVLVVVSLIVPRLWTLIGAARDGLSRRLGGLTSLAMGVVWSAAVIPAVVGVEMVIMWIVEASARARGVVPPSPTAHVTLRRLVDSGDHDRWWFITVLLAVVGAPIIEEVVYRGLLQTSLLHLTRSAWWSILVTSVVFTAAHLEAVPAYALPALFCLSIGFGLAMERTGRLWTPMLMHVVFNLYNVAAAVWLTPAP